MINNRNISELNNIITDFSKTVENSKYFGKPYLRDVILKLENFRNSLKTAINNTPKTPVQSATKTPKTPNTSSINAKLNCKSNFITPTTSKNEKSKVNTTASKSTPKVSILSPKTNNVSAEKQKYSGVVKSFNFKTCYGFIIYEVESNESKVQKEIFVHNSSIIRSKIEDKRLRTLEVNEPVEFQILVKDKRNYAINVTGPHGADVKGIEINDIANTQAEKISKRLANSLGFSLNKNTNTHNILDSNNAETSLNAPQHIGRENTEFANSIFHPKQKTFFNSKYHNIFRVARKENSTK